MFCSSKLQHPREKPSAIFHQTNHRFDKLWKSWRRPVNKKSLAAGASDQSAAPSCCRRLFRVDVNLVHVCAIGEAAHRPGRHVPVLKTLLHQQPPHTRELNKHWPWRTEQTDDWEWTRAISRRHQQGCLPPSQLPREHHSFAIYNSLKSISRCGCLPRGVRRLP